MVFTRVHTGSHTKSRLIFWKTGSGISRGEILIGRLFRGLTVDTASGQYV